MKTLSIMIVFINFNFLVIMNAQFIGTGARAYHSIAVDENGKVYTWGSNHYGQLGNNTTTQSNVPIDISSYGALYGKTIAKVAVGLEHSIAVDNSGIVYTWGINDKGQLGDGTTVNKNTPHTVNTSGVLSGKTITQVAAGENFCLAVDNAGKVYSWGYNNYGQLGNGNTSQSTVPVDVYSSGVLEDKTITQVAGGTFNSMALGNDGKVYTWGYNYYGQLGNGSNTNSNEPVAVVTTGVLSGKTIIQIAAGEHHCVALGSDGKVYTWGYNYYGQLGNGSNTNSNEPVAVVTTGVLSGKTIIQIAAGEHHCVALGSDGKVYTWGKNDSGQLGDSTNINSNVPVAVKTSGVLNGKTITQVASGASHCVVLGSNGKVYTWGENGSGQLGNNSTTSSNVPVEASFSQPLPVELILFNAFVNDNSVRLNWQTVTEINNYGFEIERTQDNLEMWNNIGFVAGSGNSNTIRNYSFDDKTISNGRYSYRLKQIDIDGKYTYSHVIEIDVKNIPTKYELAQNYPNPFNPSTNIKFAIPQKEFVTLKIYDILGNEVTTLINAELDAGNHTKIWDAKNLSSGVYFCTLQAGSFTETKKMILVR
jgi:alpha-tubulin suppressor-like RCC1 family protein